MILSLSSFFNPVSLIIALQLETCKKFNYPFHKLSLVVNSKLNNDTIKVNISGIKIEGASFDGFHLTDVSKVNIILFGILYLNLI